MESSTVYEYIAKEINKMPSDQEPIIVNQDERWHDLIEEAGDIFNKVVEQFDLTSVMVVDEGNYYRNTERGTAFYYYIEDELLSNFNIIDE